MGAIRKAYPRVTMQVAYICLRSLGIAQCSDAKSEHTAASCKAFPCSRAVMLSWQGSCVLLHTCSRAYLQCVSSLTAPGSQSLIRMQLLVCPLLSVKAELSRVVLPKVPNSVKVCFHITDSLTATQVGLESPFRTVTQRGMQAELLTSSHS